jgi:hypothetical protein
MYNVYSCINFTEGGIVMNLLKGALCLCCLCWDLSNATSLSELSSDIKPENSGVVRDIASIKAKNPYYEEGDSDEEATPNVILGACGLIGNHLPHMKAIFERDNTWIRCSEVWLSFDSLPKYFCPNIDGSVPFFIHFEKCARRKAISVSEASAAIDAHLYEDGYRDGRFVIVEVHDPLEIIAHYLAFYALEKQDEQEHKSSMTAHVMRRHLKDDEILTLFRAYLKNSGKTDNAESAKALQEITMECISSSIASFPNGGVLVPTMEFDVMFCSLLHYKWIKNTIDIIKQKAG